MTGEERKPGPIETAVLADLAKVGELAVAGQLTNAALAIKLARTLDNRGDDELGSQLAKAVDTLRITMGKLTEAGHGSTDRAEQIAALLSSPAYGGSEVSATVRYPKKPGPANPRRGGGKGRESAG